MIAQNLQKITIEIARIQLAYYYSRQRNGVIEVRNKRIARARAMEIIAANPDGYMTGGEDRPDFDAIRSGYWSWSVNVQ